MSQKQREKGVFGVFGRRSSRVTTEARAEHHHGSDVIARTAEKRRNIVNEMDGTIKLRLASSGTPRLCILATSAPSHLLAQPLEPKEPALSGDKPPPLTLRTYIALPGVYGRMDHYGWDNKRGVLLVTALGNNTVEIVDQWKRVFGFNPFHGGSGLASFPSGHVAAICAVITILWWSYPTLRPIYVACAAAVTTGLIGANYHFLSDILGGIFVGASVGYVTIKILSGKLISQSILSELLG